jgi:predicted O-methyltransferase YrrM
VYDSKTQWRDVDSYFERHMVHEDAALQSARANGRAAGLPDHEVAPNQAKLLAILCQIVGARRVLEFGTLAGYSAIWFARAVGADGHVTTLEVDAHSAAVARSNFEQAGLTDRITLMEGPAVDSLALLVDRGAEPYDLVFIDADKPNNPAYLAGAIQLSRPGTVIVADNVVRNGAVTDSESDDPRVVGSRALIELMGRDSRLDATAIQTVGVKGWAGFAIARVR